MWLYKVSGLEVVRKLICCPIKNIFLLYLKSFFDLSKNNFFLVVGEGQILFKGNFDGKKKRKDVASGYFQVEGKKSIFH